MNAEQHDDLEAIRQLQARYYRIMDTQQWDQWGDCFTEDVSAFYEGAPRPSDDLPTEIGIEGRDALVEGVRSLMTGAVSIHQGYMPEIELTSATTAHGVWSMFDGVYLPTCHFKGWGHYHNDFVKQDGQWKIKKIYLTRLRTEEVWL